jgi:hypothetical protein
MLMGVKISDIDVDEFSDLENFGNQVSETLINFQTVNHSVH